MTIFEPIDYGPLDEKAVNLASEMLETLENCFLTRPVEDRTNAINYIASNLQLYGKED